MKQNLRYLCYDTLGCPPSVLNPCRTTLNRCSGLSQCVVHVSIDNIAEEGYYLRKQRKEKIPMVFVLDTNKNHYHLVMKQLQENCLNKVRLQYLKRRYPFE